MRHRNALSSCLLVVVESPGCHAPRFLEVDTGGEATLSPECGNGDTLDLTSDGSGFEQLAIQLPTGARVLQVRASADEGRKTHVN